MSINNDDKLKIIRFKELKEIFGISRSSVDRWEKDNKFPKRIKLGENSVGWSYEEILKWKNDKINNNYR